MSYKVLLIDDQYESAPLKAFVLNASLEGIEIDCVGFHKEGIEVLKNDKQGVYQAVILDATGYLSAQDFEAGKDLNNVGLTHTLHYLERVKSERVIPWFIYSGQEKNFGNLEFEGTIKLYQSDYKFGRSAICYYRKSLDENALFEDIKVEVEKLLRTRVLLQYDNVFNVIHEIPNLEKHRFTLIEILEDLHKIQDYTRVRKVIESLFQSLADVHILPNDFTKEAGWINGASRFLSCNHKDFDFLEPDFIHPTICETLYRILNTIQDASHNEGALRYKVDEYSKLHTSGYLYQSVVYALLEIICYFGDLIKNNLDKEKNQSRWKRKEFVKDTTGFIEGVLEKINDKGWGTVKCLDGKVVDLHPKSIERFQLQVGETFSVLSEFVEEKNKYHIKNIKKNNG